MAFSINLAILTGNVTRDPELKFTPSGQAVCSFGVATNRSIKRGDNWEDVPTFHNVIVWGKQAEYIANSVKKGAPVSIQGRIDNRSYEAKDGTKRYISEVVADTVVSLSGRRASEPGTEENLPPQPVDDKTQDSKSNNEEQVEDIVIPDDLPF